MNGPIEAIGEVTDITVEVNPGADNDCGRSVDPEDLDAFADGLASLIDDPERPAMGERGRAFVEAWVSPAGVATAYGELFAELTD